MHWEASSNKAHILPKDFSFFLSTKFWLHYSPPQKNYKVPRRAPWSFKGIKNYTTNKRNGYTEFFFRRAGSPKTNDVASSLLAPQLPWRAEMPIDLSHDCDNDQFNEQPPCWPTTESTPAVRTVPPSNSMPSAAIGGNKYKYFFGRYSKETPPGPLDGITCVGRLLSFLVWSRKGSPKSFVQCHVGRCTRVSLAMKIHWYFGHGNVVSRRFCSHMEGHFYGKCPLLSFASTVFHLPLT